MRSPYRIVEALVTGVLSRLRTQRQGDGAATARCVGAAGEPRTASDPSTAEGTLLVDAGGRVLEVRRAQTTADHRLGEVLERWHQSARLTDLHPSLTNAIQSARRLGASGARFALIPDLLSQPFPVRISVAPVDDGRGHYSAVVSSLTAGSPLALTAAESDSTDLLALALTDAAARAFSMSTVESDVLPTLCEMLAADACAVYASVHETEEPKLLAAMGHMPQGPARSIRLADMANLQARRQTPADAVGLWPGDAEWFGWHLEPTSALLAGYRAARGARGDSQVIAFLRDRRARPVVSAATALTAVDLVVSKVAAIAASGALAKMAADLETVYTVTKTISRSLDVDSTFHEIALSAAQAIEGSSCILFELDRGLSQLVAVASSDAEASATRGLRFRFASAEEARATLKRRTAIVVEDLRGDYGVDPQLGEVLTMRSALFVPMLVQEAPIGSLLLYSKETEREYAASDLRMVEHIADQAASAVENARLYRDLRVSESKIRSLLHRVSLTREQQRTALASIVHDEITQSMVGAIYELESVVEELGDDQSRSVGKALAVLRDATRRSREVIASLRSPVLDELGLPHALHSLAADLQTESGIRCQVECSGTRELPNAVESSLYRIAREALVNVRKHARASSVRIIFGCEGAKARLEVSDDGRGLKNEEAADSTEHFGIVMMQELAAACGGSCRVEPGRKGGVSVVTTIPLSAEPRVTRNGAR